MSNYRRFGTFCVAVFAAFAFLTIGLGPERLDPWVTGLLGLKGPDPVRLLEVPRAEEVASRVLDGIRESNIRETMAYLTGLGSRVPGYAGHEAAARFIESKFRELGLERVTTESFDITSPVDQGGTLTNLDTGETFPIHGIWPNLVKTSTLPRGGIRTQLIDGGDGTFRALNGRDVEKTAVLMEFNTWNNWLKAAMLGAEQVIFIEPDSTSFTQAEQKFLQVPNSVERFWIDQASGRRLQAQLKEKGTISVELKARMEWEKNPAKNILGWIPGTDPVLRDKIVVINAYYDAMSVVPALAPGAEMACGIVGLLELASYFHTFPPGHTVLFLASTGHHLGSRGISDFLNRHSRKEKHFKALMSDPIDIPLFIGLDLSSQTDEIGVWNGSEHFFYKRFFTPFGKSFVQFGKAIAKRIGLDPRTALIDGINPKGGVNWDMYMPGENLKVDGEWVLKAGTPALNLVTVNDARFRVDTPLDTPAFVNYKNLTGQIRLLAGVLDLSLNWEPFLPSYKLEPDDRMRALKGYVRTFPRRSITPNKPRPGAIAVLRTVSNGYPRTGSPKSVRGVRMIYYDLADEKGEFYIPGLIDFANRANPRVNLQTFYLDPESGEITYAPNRKTTNRAYSDTFVANWWTIERTLILFPCVATDFYDTVDPRYLNTLHQISVYGEGNTVPQEYGYSIGSGEDEPVGVVFTSPGEKVKVAMRSGSIGVRLLLLNSSSAETKQIARGAGFQIWSHGSFVRTSFQAAKDMWTLNEARMQELRDFSIENQRLEALHAQAKHHIDEAERAMQEKDWDSFAKHSRAGLGIESRAYPDVKATQNDVIRGVIFFMILVIPCAFFVERLVFTASDIRWQILGLTGVFIVIWMLISQVHPAFQLSNPFVILLSFVIMFLALFVIAIVFGRFNDNMRRLRSDDVLLHDTDVGRVSASVAAFHLGIANMKRRKLRTWLTFVTLVLLTFTVLSFTSIKSSLEFHQLHRDVEGVYPGFLIRSKFWGALEESAYDYASVNFKDVAIVVPRSWYVTKENKKTPVSVGKQSVKAPGVLGMVPEEAQVTGIDKLLTTGRWFRPGETACILPGKTADLLGVKPRDVGRKHVRLFGKQLKVIGLIDGVQMRELLDLDQEMLSPADFQSTEDDFENEVQQLEEREKQGLEGPEVETMPFEHLDPEDVIIVPYAMLRDVGSPLQSVAVRFQAEVDVEAQIKAFLSRLSVVLFAGIPDETGKVKVSVYSSMGNTSLGGLGHLFVPILVAALIVLNTMMGSVYERFKEIGIYSAVGLAPVHIAFLFIAEACVYAVLGTVTGYLLGQGVAKVLLWQGWLSGFTLNYSALSTVASSMLVMLVVILSTIYPAHQASKMAVPDVTRRWKLPDPEGDRWNFEFPFTVGEQDVFGLSVFLVDYFEAHMGESMGMFYTNGASLEAVETEKGEGYTIDTSVWLSPYDLGVSQTVRFDAVPTGDHGIFTMSLTIIRLSGDAASWRRVNRNFMNGLRKQFLIWRTVTPEDKGKYKEKGQTMLVGGIA